MRLPKQFPQVKKDAIPLILAALQLPAPPFENHRLPPRCAWGGGREWLQFSCGQLQ